MAAQDLFKPASAIVDDVLLQEMGNALSQRTWQELKTERDKI